MTMPNLLDVLNKNFNEMTTEIADENIDIEICNDDVKTFNKKYSISKNDILAENLKEEDFIENPSNDKFLFNKCVYKDYTVFILRQNKPFVSHLNNYKDTCNKKVNPFQFSKDKFVKDIALVKKICDCLYNSDIKFLTKLVANLNTKLVVIFKDNKSIVLCKQYFCYTRNSHKTVEESFILNYGSDYIIKCLKMYWKTYGMLWTWFDKRFFTNLTVDDLLNIESRVDLGIYNLMQINFCDDKDIVFTAFTAYRGMRYDNVVAKKYIVRKKDGKLCLEIRTPCKEDSVIIEGKNFRKNSVIFQWSVYFIGRNNFV